MVCGRLPKDTKHNETLESTTTTTTNDNSFIHVDIEDDSFEILNSNDEIEEQEHEQEVQHETVTRRSSRRQKKHKKSNTYLPARPMSFNKTEGKKTKGNRVKRRHENMLELIKFLGDENDDLDLDRDLTIDDFIMPKMSAFARIMLESTQLKLWSDFISRSGQEQDEIIEFAEQLLLRKQNNKRKLKSNLKQFTEYLQQKQLKKSPSNDFMQDYLIVNEHDNYQDEKVKNVIGKYLFTKIDKNIRDVFKRSFSHEKLCELEEIILNTFSNSPDSIYISKLPDSFDRMVLHGICQYFSLSSKSFEKNGCKHTQVENTYNEFTIPCIRLSEYVKLNFSV